MEAVADIDLTEEERISTPPFYSTSKAALRAGVTFHKLVYDAGRNLITPFQKEPIILYSEKEIDRYKNALMSSDN
jgi:hypothetical protein